MRQKLKEIAHGRLEVHDNRVTSMMIHEILHLEDGSFAMITHSYTGLREDDLDDEFA